MIKQRAGRIVNIASIIGIMEMQAKPIMQLPKAV